MKGLRRGAALCIAVGVGALVGSSSAAAAPSTAWKIEQMALPTAFPPHTQGEAGGAVSSTPRYRIAVTNVGSGAAPSVTMTDTLPEGTSPTVGSTPEIVFTPNAHEVVSEPCQVSGRTVTCDLAIEMRPGSRAVAFLPVDVQAGEGTAVTNVVTVSAPTGITQRSELTTEVSTASPPFGALSGDGGVTPGVFDEEGRTPVAGAHPFSMDLPIYLPTVQRGILTPLGPLRAVGLSLPPGVVVNPAAVSQPCTQAQLEGEFDEPASTCPPASQVGMVSFNVPGQFENAYVPLYELAPQGNVPAELGFSLVGVFVRIQGGLDGAFQLTARATEILSKYPVGSIRAEVWGNPSDPRHDYLRSGGVGRPGAPCYVGCSVEPSPVPLLTMPSSCSPSLSIGISLLGWDGSTASGSRVFTDGEGNVQSVNGCERLNFAPSASIRPTVSQADAPSGLLTSIRIPQNQALNGLAAATLKKVTVRLPQGMAVNPPAADGLGTCSLGQIGIGNEEPAVCPGSSKVGTVELETPLLRNPLKGAVYVAEQERNPFGSLLALYLVVEGEGLVVKLPGRIDLAPTTGELTATFDNTPQLPFETLNVEFNSGPRATLVTPTACGDYNIRTELTSWASTAPVVVNSPFVIDQACATGGFSPKLEAGTTNPVAGSYSSFTLRVTREDGEQNLSRIAATLPKGVLAKLSGVGLCSDALAATGECPPASQVGTTTAGVGAGPQPLFIPQAGRAPTAVYLAGPYKGSPYSLVVKVPAQAGPFDLGTIAVRVAIGVDPFTAQVTASSDPLPQILDGVPVAYRDVRIDASRSDFILNPTSCEPTQVTSAISSSDGASAYPVTRFQVAGCERLAFKPSLKLSLKGATKRTGHPALKAVLTYPKSGAFANIARAQVNLPHSEFLDQGSLNKTCTKPILLEGRCPKSSVYGRATAWTPLLDRPLEGPVYLVGGFGYKLPALVAELTGQIRVLLKGKVDTGPNKGIRNTFEAVPDAPVTRFVLEMKGGRKYGLFENSEDLCRRAQVGRARFTAQSGKVEQLSLKIANSCRTGKGKQG